MNKTIRKQRSFKTFEIFCILLFSSLFIRVYSFIGDTELSKYNSQVLLILEILAITLGFVKALSLRNLSFSSFEISAVLFWIWSCFSTMINETDIKELIKNIVFQSFWLIVFLFFSIYLKDRKRQKINFVFKLALLFTVITSVYYIYWSLTRPVIVLSGTINTVYYPLLLIPLIFTKRSKFSTALIVLVVLFATLISEKRTALIALVLSIVVPVLVNPVSRHKSKLRRTTLFLVIALVVVALSSVFVLYFEVDIIDRFMNLSLDGGSGRNQIYAVVWDTIKGLNVKDLFIGNGFNAVAKDKIVMLIDSNVFGFEYTSAHNDFLEVIYDYGIIGIILYAAFLIQMLRVTFKLYKKRSRYFSMALSACIIYLTVSTTSHLIIYPTYIVFLLLFMSVALNSNRKDEKN